MLRSGLTVSALAMTAALCAAQAARAQDPETQGQVEYCKTWTVEGDHWGATNHCDQTIVVHLLVRDVGLDRTWTLKAGERLVTDLAARPTTWMATTCPGGYEPSVPVDWDTHRADIMASNYHCVKR
jgi:hypothetical protein